MNKYLELLLELEELILLQKGRAVRGSLFGESACEELEAKMNRLRRRVPGRILSQFDKLTKAHANAVVTVSGQVCQGCHQEVARSLMQMLGQRNQIVHCPHCGRFLLANDHAPDFIAPA